MRNPIYGKRVKKRVRRWSWRAIRKANRRRKQSSLEVTVLGWLREDAIPFQREVPVGRCHVDVMIGETAVEINGCYWHSCPGCYPIAKPNQRHRRRQDARRYRFLRRRGHPVRIVWECQVQRKPGEVRRRLRQIAKREFPEE